MLFRSNKFINHVLCMVILGFSIKVVDTVLVLAGMYISIETPTLLRVLAGTKKKKIFFFFKVL